MYRVYIYIYIKYIYKYIYIHDTLSAKIVALVSAVLITIITY